MHRVTLVHIYIYKCIMYHILCVINEIMSCISTAIQNSRRSVAHHPGCSRLADLAVLARVPTLSRKAGTRGQTRRDLRIQGKARSPQYPLNATRMPPKYHPEASTYIKHDTQACTFCLDPKLIQGRRCPRKRAFQFKLWFFRNKQRLRLLNNDFIQISHEYKRFYLQRPFLKNEFIQISHEHKSFYLQRPFLQKWVYTHLARI